MSDDNIEADRTLFSCLDDLETCCCGLFFPCGVYGQNRARVGLQGRWAATAVLLLPLALLAAVAVLITGSIRADWEVCRELFNEDVVLRCNVSGVVSTENCDVCPVPTDCDAYVATDSCTVPFPSTIYVYGCGLGVIMGAFAVTFLGSNRSLLQRTLGMRDEGFLNYLVYSILPLCALCQEARAVKSRLIQLQVQMPTRPGQKGKPHRLDFETQEEPDPDGLSFFTYTWIVCFFVGYWYAVAALYFYGSLNESTPMVVLGALLTPLPCIAIVVMRWREVQNRKVLRENAGGTASGPEGAKGRGWKWVYEAHPNATVYDASQQKNATIGCRSDRLQLRP